MTISSVGFDNADITEAGFSELMRYHGEVAAVRSAPDLRVPAALVRSGPVRLREQQRVFAKTGALHAAGLLTTDGDMLCVREDVGRHNAVDKVIGLALRQRRLPLRDSVLVVSGRASYELTQKAVLAGIGMLVAVSAPSSLAVDLAAEAGLTLVGFVRGEWNFVAVFSMVCFAIAALMVVLVIVRVYRRHRQRKGENE